MWTDLDNTRYDEKSHAEEALREHVSRSGKHPATQLLARRLELDHDALHYQPYSHWLDAVTYRDNREAFGYWRSKASDEASADYLEGMIGPIAHTIWADDQKLRRYRKADEPVVEVDERYKADLEREISEVVNKCEGDFNAHSKQLLASLHQWEKNVRELDEMPGTFAASFDGNPYLHSLAKDMVELHEAGWVESVGAGGLEQH